MKRKALLGIFTLLLVLVVFSGCDLLGLGNPLIGEWTRSSQNFIYHRISFAENEVVLTLPETSEILYGTYTKDDNYLFISWNEGGGGEFAYSLTNSNSLSITWGNGETCSYFKN